MQCEGEEEGLGGGGLVGGRVKRAHFPPSQYIHTRIKEDLWKVEGGCR